MTIGIESFNRLIFQWSTRLHRLYSMYLLISLSQVFGIVSNTEMPMMVLEFLDKGDLKSLLLDSGNSMTCDHLVTICENVS